jgi:hypothetical protein
MDLQEVTWVSTGPWIRSSKSTNDLRKETMLEVAPVVRYLCSQSELPNQESGPNASVQRRGPVRKDSGRCSRDLPTERPRKPIPPDRYGIFTMRTETYSIPKEETSTVAELLVTNLFCCFGVPRELRSDQGSNFKSCLI